MRRRQPAAPPSKTSRGWCITLCSDVTSLADLERQAILKVIRSLRGDKLQAAKLLGIGKADLSRKLKEYGITDPLHDS